MRYTISKIKEEFKNIIGFKYDDYGHILTICVLSSFSKVREIKFRRTIPYTYEVAWQTTEDDGFPLDYAKRVMEREGFETNLNYLY